MPCDIVIPYQLINKGYELKYALRGVEKYLSGVGEVFIVGDLPEWCQNVIHIPFEQTRGNIKWKERNIFEKVLTACNDERVSNSFLFMNDDHFLLSDYEAGKFPDYWHEDLLYNQAMGDYGLTIKNTLMALVLRSTFNYDCHAPAIFNRYTFRCVGRHDWDKPFGYALKSLYINMFNNEGKQYPDFKYPDLKIKAPLTYPEITELIKDRKWFSISDRALNQDMKTVLNELYETPSRYER
jgi:hypothetical protein